jgi:hypothetical protein
VIASFLQTAKHLLTWSARKNIRFLADEGFELMETDGIYFLKYGDDIIELGEREATAKELNHIFDKSTNSKAKTV